MTDAGPPVAALVTVGNELLLGETVDTNAAWLGRALAARGVAVTSAYTVGDVESDIRTAVEAATRVADLVVVSGGLGPTPDDITKEAVAALFGRRLIVAPDLLAALERRFLDRGFGELPAPNRSQAEVPEGALLLENRHGTAPGLALDEGSTMIVLLPGVPRELKGIVAGALSALLDERFGARQLPVHHRTVHTTGVPESRLSELVEAVLPPDMGPVSLAFLPDLRGVDLRMTARGVRRAEAEEWFARLEAVLRPVVEPWRFEAPSGDVAEALMDELVEAGKTVAVAESCTGGLVAKRVTDLAGSSAVFVGGVIAYSDDVKVDHLGVRRDELAAHGAVSEAVAVAMASGVAERFGASSGIGVTGIAGPGGGTPEKPVGTVWIAATLDGEVVPRHLSLPGDREAVRERAAQAALALLHDLLRRGDPRA